MRYTIQACERQTGKDKTVTILASNQDEAIHKAADLGLVVTRVYPTGNRLSKRLILLAIILLGLFTIIQYFNSKSMENADVIISKMSQFDAEIKTSLLEYLPTSEKVIRLEQERERYLVLLGPQLKEAYGQKSQTLDALAKEMRPSAETLVNLKNDVDYLGEAWKQIQSKNLLSTAKRLLGSKQSFEAVNTLGELLKLNPDHPEGIKLYRSIRIDYNQRNMGDVLTNSLGMELVFIPANEFLMGSPTDESDRMEDERQHLVRLTEPFLMAVTEITQGQWETLLESRPWDNKDDAISHPSNAASYINNGMALKFCKLLSKREGKTYRLPTEAEWEYSCRAESSTAYYFGNDNSDLTNHAWFAGNIDFNSSKHARAVGQKLPNYFGLYDMYGNVEEWCSDWYDKYPTAISTNPKGPPSGRLKELVEYPGAFLMRKSILRGGSWNSNAQDCRSAKRKQVLSLIGGGSAGFRVVLVF